MGYVDSLIAIYTMYNLLFLFDLREINKFVSFCKLFISPYHYPCLSLWTLIENYNASAPLSEQVKNNYETITKFELKKVEL